MKKKLLVLIAMVLMLVGCKPEKFYLDDEHYDKVGIVEIDNKELKKKEIEILKEPDWELILLHSFCYLWVAVCRWKVFMEKDQDSFSL